LIDSYVSQIIECETLHISILLTCKKCVPQKYNSLANLRSQTYKEKHA